VLAVLGGEGGFVDGGGGGCGGVGCHGWSVGGLFGVEGRGMEGVWVGESWVMFGEGGGG